MEDRSLQFITIMALIGAVGIAAFLLILVSKALSKRQAESAGEKVPSREPHWLAVALSGLAVVIATALLLWFLFPGSYDQLGSVAPRAGHFLIVMLIVAAIALIAFIVALIARASRPETERTEDGFAVPDAAKPPVRPASAALPDGAVPVSAGLRLLFLLIVPVALLIFGWSALSHDVQHGLTVRLAYPAVFAVVMVLLIDKATRAWSTKSGAEIFREWMFLDLFLVLLMVAFWNLTSVADPAAYRSFFWDILGLAGLFLAFWLVDRTATRFRFLLAYAFLVLLPVLLIIWRYMTPAAPPAEGVELSWWDTYWPVFYLAIIFGVLEIILLAASRDHTKQGLATLKDTLFIVVYGILLLVAIP